ncbi:MAG: cupin domain-containing protein [Acidobacteriales bacterium]|nr:cupin domain-containing protein [Terriglobales bacterium]
MQILKEVDWSKVPSEDLSSHIRRRYVNQNGVTLARFELKKGGLVGKHQHVNAQITNVFSGALKFLIDGKEITVRGGETLFIPPNMPHEVHVPDDATVLDIFIPERADWAANEDAYLRQK